MKIVRGLIFQRYGKTFAYLHRNRPRPRLIHMGGTSKRVRA